MTADDIMADAAVLLNDREQVQWSDTDLLPFLQKAYREFSLRARELGIQSIMEVSAKVDIPTSKTSITTTDILDLSYPIKLAERADGSADLYYPMTELTWDPQIEKAESLDYWVWREDEIKLVGATTAREVLVYYKKNVTEISTGITPIYILDSRLFLAARTAALAAALAGGNMERAQILNDDAEESIQSYFNSQIKSKQGNVVRHKSYRRR